MRPIFLITFFLSTFFFASPFFVYAQGAGVSAPAIELSNPIQLKDASGKAVKATPQAIVGNIIKSVLGILGGAVLLVFVYGGFLWLTSAGKEDQIKQGTKTMQWAAIGLFLVFASYGILTTVLKGLGVVQ